MNQPLDALPFDIHSLIPYDQFNWDCVDGLDCVYKDIQSAYVSVVSHIGKGLEAQERIINAIVDAITKHYTGSIDFANDAANEIRRMVEEAIRKGLSEVQGTPPLTESESMPYVVYRESNCGSFYPMVELWPQPPQDREYYGPYPNQFILRNVATDVLPLKQAADIIYGGNPNTIPILKSRYYSSEPVNISGRLFGPNDYFAEDTLNTEWNGEMSDAMNDCRPLPKRLGTVINPPERYVDDDTGFHPPIIPPTIIPEDDYVPSCVDPTKFVDDSSTHMLPEPIAEKAYSSIDQQNNGYLAVYTRFNQSCHQFGLRRWKRTQLTARLGEFPFQEVYVSDKGEYLTPNNYNWYCGICIPLLPPTPPVSVDPPETYNPPTIPEDKPPEYYPPNQPPTIPLTNTCCDDIVNALNTIADRLGSGDDKKVDIEDGDVTVTGIPDTKYEMSTAFVTDYNAMLSSMGLASYINHPYADMNDLMNELMGIASTPTSNP